eukprot:TRINITY_DN34808_c0_g1_i2.p1 TRINITY_DN34808_c0_g1~~TRINITY_DN34808_c0_g1_i2.p1  ORF type:complete len:288 (-),score=31.14 TRINITY_DN34808_c0_g1_i2:468-1331(-)
MNMTLVWFCCFLLCFFFFQAEDGIRDHAQSRGLGDVYKRQAQKLLKGLDKDKVNLLLLTQINCGDHYDCGIAAKGNVFNCAKMVCEAAEKNEFIDRVVDLISNKSIMPIIEKLHEKLLEEEEFESTEKEVVPDENLKDVLVTEPELTETRQYRDVYLLIATYGKRDNSDKLAAWKDSSRKGQPNYKKMTNTETTATDASQLIDIPPDKVRDSALSIYKSDISESKDFLKDFDSLIESFKNKIVHNKSDIQRLYDFYYAYQNLVYNSRIAVKELTKAFSKDLTLNQRL